MARAVSSPILQLIRRVVEDEGARELSDPDLLQRFRNQRDETAFHALLRRHGPMVLDVCRGVLGNEADAEDAFQATFLVLCRKAGSIRQTASLGPWLHGVARRTALKTKAQFATRQNHEARVPARQVSEPDNLSWREVRQVLHEELSRLSERYQGPLVLCYLEGMRQEKAAALLGMAKSTLKERLERGRALLRVRLLARGLGPAMVLVTAAWPGAVISAYVSSRLVCSTIKAATLFMGGQAAAVGAIPANVAALTEGVLKSMLITKVKSAIAALLVLGIIALGAGQVISSNLATEPAGGMPDMQERGQANPDDLHERVVELKQQLQQMQKKIARLEQETQPRRDESNKCDTTFLADRFKYRVPFEIVHTESKEGGRIEIHEVWGTRPRIEVGGQYLVRGKYVLPPGQRGMLYFYASAGGPWGLTSSLDLQSTVVEKQEGEFALVHGMAGPGFFHLYLAAEERYSRWFADVYFGTGDNVYRKKP